MINLEKTAKAYYQNGDIIECLYNGELHTYDSYYDTFEHNKTHNVIWLVTRGSAPNILVYDKKWATITSRPSDKNIKIKNELSTLLTKQQVLIKELNIINRRIIKSYEELNEN